MYCLTLALARSAPEITSDEHGISGAVHDCYLLRYTTAIC